MSLPLKSKEWKTSIKVFKNNNNNNYINDVKLASKTEGWMLR